MRLESLVDFTEADDIVTLPCDVSGKNFCCCDNCPEGLKDYKEVDTCYAEHKKTTD